MFTNRDLHHYCRCNNTEWVNRILDTSKDINVLYEYGTFFRFATKNNNVEICSALLTYFEEKQFSDKDDKYLEARYQLKEILENATYEREIPKEMKHVLSSYLDLEFDLDSRLQEFGEEEESNYQLWINSLQTENHISETVALKYSGETEPIYSIQELSDIS